MFDAVEGRAGEANQKKWRDPVRHAFSKTKREETDNSETIRLVRLFPKAGDNQFVDNGKRMVNAVPLPAGLSTLIEPL